MSTTGIIVMLMVGFVFFLQVSQKRIREKEHDLFNAVLNAQQKEQERIARDLHDQIGPLLSIIKSQVECIDDAGLTEEDQNIKAEVGEQLGTAVNEVRSIAHNLIPNTFGEYGFLKSIEYYIIRLKEFNTMDVEFTYSAWPDTISKNYEMSLYRILLELFQNTFKHAKATKVILDLRVKENKLAIAYSDNGIGIDDAAINNKGIGLKNIDARVNFLKGSYHITSVPGEATAWHFNFDMNMLNGK